MCCSHACKCNHMDPRCACDVVEAEEGCGYAHPIRPSWHALRDFFLEAAGYGQTPLDMPSPVRAGPGDHIGPEV